MKVFERLVMYRTSKPASDGLASTRVKLHQPVKELVAFVERAHADALVETVHRSAVRIAEHAVHTVGRNAGVDSEAAVGRAREQGGHHRHARPHQRTARFDLAHDLARGG